VLQYGSVEAFVRIVSHADAEVQSMVRASPADYSRYRNPSNDFWVLTSSDCVHPAAKYHSDFIDNRVPKTQRLALYRYSLVAASSQWRFHGAGGVGGSGPHNLGSA